LSASGSSDITLGGEAVPPPTVSAFVGRTVNLVLYLARANGSPSSKYFNLAGGDSFPELAPHRLGVLTAFGVFLLPLGLIFYLYARSETDEPC
jgi:hypothetical protein